MSLRLNRTVLRLVAVALCGLLAAWPGVAAEKGKKADAPAKKAAEKAPAKAKAKATKAKSKAKPAAKAVEEAPKHPSQLPWSIRGNYKITYGEFSMLYSSDNAEWCILRNKDEVIVDNTGMVITLGDGSVLDVVRFPKGETNFQEVKDDTGSFRRFWMQTSPEKGVTVRGSLDRYYDRPFMIMRTEIKNVGDKPVTVREVTTAVFDAKGLALSPEATMTVRPAIRRGGYFVYDPGAPQFALFSDPAKKFTLGLARLPEASDRGTMAFSKVEGGWQGKVTCDYGPGRLLNPGESLPVSPLLLNFFMKPSDIEDGCAFAMAMLSKPLPEAPSAWVSVPATEGPQALSAAAQAWAGSGVKHALVPAPFSGDEGYAYNARQTASDLKSMKMTPGIAVDPLGAQGAAENLTVADPKGRRWINPTSPEARDFAVQKLKPLADWGYAFFVVPPSEIPDEALAAMGISRSQADEYAFEIAAAAAGDRPVVPSAMTTLGGDVDPWLEADAATARLRLHGGNVGPVRVDVSKLGDPTDGLAMAISMFPGPLELVGTPAGGVSRKVQRLFPRPATSAQPLDGANQAPKLWQAQEHEVKGSLKSLVVAFPGAPAWTPADLSKGFAEKYDSLRVEADGRIVKAQK